MRSLTLVLASILTACGGPAASPPEEGEPALLRLGRKAELHGDRYSLMAHFDLVGPVVAALDTSPTNDAGWQLAPGAYAITIRSDFSLWRDVAVAQVQVPGELMCDAEQRFEARGGETTLLAYQFLVDGGEVDFQPD